MALRVKRLGLWEQVTWSAHARRVRDLALGLSAAGVKGGEPVALLGEATPESLALDLACQALGALAMPINPNSSMTDVHYLLQLSRTRFLAAGDLETLDRLRTAPELDGVEVRTAVLIDGSIIRTVRDWRLLTLPELERLGAESTDRRTLGELAGTRSAEEPMSLHATSGTQGHPRLVPISSAGLTTAWSEFLGSFGPTRSDSFVVEAPLSHVTGRAAVLLLPLLFGAVAHFPEHPDAVDEAMSDVVPTLSVALPQRWEARAAGFRSRLAEAGRLHRLAVRASLRARERALAADAAGRPTGPPSRLAAAAGHRLVLRPMLTKAGLQRLRAAAAGGRYMAPEMLTYWHALGVPLTVFYGTTEASGLIAYQPSVRTAGALRPVGALSLRLGTDGEIEVRLPTTAGALAPGASGSPGERFDGEHWVGTGDRGELNEAGELLLSYRLSDLVQVGGREVPIGEIERLLLSQGHIKHAAVIGRGRPYLTALIDLDVPSAAAWARANSVRYGSLAGLAEEPRVVELIAGRIEAANAELAARGLPQVEQFAVLRAAEAFEATDVLALTGEVRRAEVEKRYAGVLDALYSRPTGPHGQAASRGGDG